MYVCSAEGVSGEDGNDSGAGVECVTDGRRAEMSRSLDVYMQRHVRVGESLECWQMVSRQRCLHACVLDVFHAR
jgi:hypothetical protein